MKIELTFLIWASFATDSAKGWQVTQPSLSLPQEENTFPRHQESQAMFLRNINSTWEKVMQAKLRKGYKCVNSYC